MSVSLQILTLHEFLERISEQQLHHSAIILHYDVLAVDLRIWFWCVNLPLPETGHNGTDGLLIGPFGMADCQLHQLLCVSTKNATFSGRHVASAFTSRATANTYIKSAIYVATISPFSGQYVFGCGSGRCGYLSESVGALG